MVRRRTRRILIIAAMVLPACGGTSGVTTTGGTASAPDVTAVATSSNSNAAMDTSTTAASIAPASACVALAQFVASAEGTIKASLVAHRADTDEQIFARMKGVATLRIDLNSHLDSFLDTLASAPSPVDVDSAKQLVVLNDNRAEKLLDALPDAASLQSLDGQWRDLIQGSQFSFHDFPAIEAATQALPSCVALTTDFDRVSLCLGSPGWGYCGADPNPDDALPTLPDGRSYEDFIDPDATYTIEIGADWRGVTNSAVKSIEQWTSYDNKAGVAINTQPTAGLDLTKYLDVLQRALTSSGLGTVVSVDTTVGSSGRTLGIIEYTGKSSTTAGGAGHVLAVIDVNGGIAVIATMESAESDFSQERTDLEPFLLSLKATPTT